LLKKYEEIHEDLDQEWNTPIHLPSPNITTRYQLFGHIVERMVQTKTIELYPVPDAIYETVRQTEKSWKLFLS